MLFMKQMFLLLTLLELINAMAIDSSSGTVPDIPDNSKMSYENYDTQYSTTTISPLSTLKSEYQYIGSQVSQAGASFSGNITGQVSSGAPSVLYAPKLCKPYERLDYYGICRTVYTFAYVYIY